MTRHFTLAQPHFVGSALLAEGSRITDADIPNTEPGRFLIETDARGAPLNPEDARRLLFASTAGSMLPQPLSPIAPHAPNPTRAQGVPGNIAGGVPLAFNDKRIVPAEGVESNEAADARVERLKRELAEATAFLDAARGEAEEEQPVRRGEGGNAALGEAGSDLLSGTVTDVEAAVGSVNDLPTIEGLIAAETANRNRVGALNALEARRAQLAPQG